MLKQGTITFQTLTSLSYSTDKVDIIKSRKILSVRRKKSIIKIVVTLSKQSFSGTHFVFVQPDQYLAGCVQILY